MKSTLRSLYNYLFDQRFLPLWILIVNYISLGGIFAWPLVCIVLYARSGDYHYNFYWLSRNQYVLISIYPLFLIMITLISFKLFRINKVIAAALPIAVILFYFYVIKMEFF